MATPKKNPKAKKRQIKTPLSVVTKQFGSKEALVKEIEKLTAKKDLLSDRLSDKGLERVSNEKLLRLHRLITEVQGKFAGRGALVDAYLELRGRSKDDPYRQKLMTYTLGRVYDMYRVALRKAKVKARPAKA